MSAPFAHGLEHFTSAGVNWNADDIRLILIDQTSFTPDVSVTGHEFLSDVPGPARTAISASLSGKSAAGGILGAASPTLSAVTGHADSYIIYKHTGVEGTSPLLVYANHNGGMPLDATAQNIAVHLDADPTRKIMSLQSRTAPGFYHFGSESFCLGNVNWLSNNIKLVLLNSGLYTVDIAADQFLADIPLGARVATSGNLASKTNTGGVLDAADITVASVTGHVDAYAVFKDTGDPATSILLIYEDCGAGFPSDLVAQPYEVRFSNDPKRKIGSLAGAL